MKSIRHDWSVPNKHNQKFRNLVINKLKAKRLWGDIDYPSHIGWVLLKKEPKLLKYAGKFLQYGLRGR